MLKIRKKTCLLYILHAPWYMLWRMKLGMIPEQKSPARSRLDLYCHYMLLPFAGPQGTGLVNQQHATHV